MKMRTLLLGALMMLVAWNASAQNTATGSTPSAQWGMTFEVRVISGTFSTSHEWDGDGSGPDVKVVIAVDGHSYETSKVQDSYEPVWNSVTRVVLNEGSELKFRVIEVDLVANDDQGGWTIPMSLAWLDSAASGKRLTFDDNVGNTLYWIDVQIVPVPGTSPAELAAARTIRPEQIVSMLAGKSVVTAIGMGWTFEANEPRVVVIVSQSNDGRVADITFDIRTSAVDGSAPASGRLRAQFRWGTGGWVLESLQNVNFAPVQ